MSPEPERAKRPPYPQPILATTPASRPLALHKRRPIRIHEGDLEVTVRHRAPRGDD